jgi:hypothetical protein
MKHEESNQISEMSKSVQWPWVWRFLASFCQELKKLIANFLNLDLIFGDIVVTAFITTN